jgi:hypothetical protein
MEEESNTILLLALRFAWDGKGNSGIRKTTWKNQISVDVEWSWRNCGVIFRKGIPRGAVGRASPQSSR